MVTIKLEASNVSHDPSKPQHVKMTITFDTLDQDAAQAVADTFPKSAKLHVTTLTGLHPSPVSYAWAVAELRSNGVNGGVNETGVKRYRAWIKAAAKAGHEIVWTTPYTNSYPTQAAFEAAVEATLRG